jgi:hypothetical protein
VRAIIGTYRKSAYVERALRSLDKHVTGITDITFIDDSGDPDNEAWVAQ